MPFPIGLNQRWANMPGYTRWAMLCSSAVTYKSMHVKKGVLPDGVDQVHNASTGVPIRTLWHVQIVGCQQGCPTPACIRHGVVGRPHQDLQPPFWDTAAVVGCSRNSGMQQPFWDAATILGCSNRSGVQRPLGDATANRGCSNRSGMHQPEHNMQPDHLQRAKNGREGQTALPYSSFTCHEAWQRPRRQGLQLLLLLRYLQQPSWTATGLGICPCFG